MKTKEKSTDWKVRKKAFHAEGADSAKALTQELAWYMRDRMLETMSKRGMKGEEDKEISSVQILQGLMGCCGCWDFILSMAGATAGWR